MRDLLSTYGFSQRRRTDGRIRGTDSCGTQSRGALSALSVPSGLILLVLSRRLRTACLGAVRATSCDRQIAASVR